MKLPKVAEAQRCVAALDVDKDGIFITKVFFALPKIKIGKFRFSLKLESGGISIEMAKV